MPLSVVKNWLTGGVECLNGSEFALKYPANLVLHPSKHLRNTHDRSGKLSFLLRTKDGNDEEEG
jgi:hypothetical protein